MYQILVAAVEGQAANRRAAGSVTARRHTSSIETMSYFQRFSARIVRSRNCGVISFALSGWNTPMLPRAHAFEPQHDAGAAGLALRQPRIAAEISELHPGPLQKPVVRRQRPAPKYGRSRPAAAALLLLFVDISLRRSAQSRKL